MIVAVARAQCQCPFEPHRYSLGVATDTLALVEDEVDGMMKRSEDRCDLADSQRRIDFQRPCIRARCDCDMSVQF